MRRLAQDAGLPIYQKLVAGPQSRKDRTKRPLRSWGRRTRCESASVMLVIIGDALFARLSVRSRITASGEVAQFALDTAIVRLGPGGNH